MSTSKWMELGEAGRERRASPVGSGTDSFDFARKSSRARYTFADQKLRQERDSVNQRSAVTRQPVHTGSASQQDQRVQPQQHDSDSDGDQHPPQSDISAYYPRGNRNKPIKWSAEEDDRLRQAVGKFSEARWKEIAKMVQTRNHVQCLQRWKKVLKPGLVKGQWSTEEDDRLVSLVERGFRNWGQVASFMDGRTSKQCRERWCHHLDPAVRKGGYTAAEDDLIVSLQGEVGNRWADIAKRLKGRTENAVKIRWKALNRRQRDARNKAAAAAAAAAATAAMAAADQREASDSGDGSISGTREETRPRARTSFPRRPASGGAAAQLDFRLAPRAGEGMLEHYHGTSDAKATAAGNLQAAREASAAGVLRGGGTMASGRGSTGNEYRTKFREGTGSESGDRCRQPDAVSKWTRTGHRPPSFKTEHEGSDAATTGYGQTAAAAAAARETGRNSPSCPPFTPRRAPRTRSNGEKGGLHRLCAALRNVEAMDNVYASASDVFRRESAATASGQFTRDIFDEYKPRISREAMRAAAKHDDASGEDPADAERDAGGNGNTSSFARLPTCPISAAVPVVVPPTAPCSSYGYDLERMKSSPARASASRLSKSLSPTLRTKPPTLRPIDAGGERAHDGSDFAESLPIARAEAIHAKQRRPPVSHLSGPSGSVATERFVKVEATEKSAKTATAIDAPGTPLASPGYEPRPGVLSSLVAAAGDHGSSDKYDVTKGVKSETASAPIKRERTNDDGAGDNFKAAAATSTERGSGTSQALSGPVSKRARKQSGTGEMVPTSADTWSRMASPSMARDAATFPHVDPSSDVRDLVKSAAGGRTSGVAPTAQMTKTGCSASTATTPNSRMVRIGLPP